jgi:carbamoyl-phosphate synthase small subunit
LLDCGAKDGIIRNLVRIGCKVSVLPSDADARAAKDVGADALFVSNGPGDPGVLLHQVGLIREMIGGMPVLGICLGHQLVSLALGATTYKMRFGHHGVNHPVRDRETGSVFVTSQNHGFAVDASSLPDGCEVWFDNANDGSLEGIVNRDLGIRTTQFHPEAAPGPYDSRWIFDVFVRTARGEA